MRPPHRQTRLDARSGGGFGIKPRQQPTAPKPQPTDASRAAPLDTSVLARLLASPGTGPSLTTINSFYHGPVEVVEQAGSGRGLVATRDVAPGELLLCCAPLAVHLGPPGSTFTPSAAVLLPQLEQCAVPCTDHNHRHSATTRPAAPPSLDSLATKGTGAAVNQLQAAAFWNLCSGVKAGVAEPGRPPPTAPSLESLVSLQPALAPDPITPDGTMQHYPTVNPAASAGGLAPSAGAGTLPPPDPILSGSVQVEEAQQPVIGAASLLSPADRRMLSRAVQQRADLNSWVEQYQDIAAASLRGEQPQALLGVFPAMALINHACCPNASVLVLVPGLNSPSGRDGDSNSSRGGNSSSSSSISISSSSSIPSLEVARVSHGTAAGPDPPPALMLVRAAAAIPCGEEVLITYCGSAVGAPVGVRRQALQQGWGFRCECSRCLVDQDYEQEPLGQALLAGYQKLVSKLRPGLLAALDTHDRAAVARHVKQVANLMEELQARLREVPDELDKAVLSGSVLPLCLDMLILSITGMHPTAKLPRALQPQQARQLLEWQQQRLHLVAQIAPGSYAHAEQSAAFLQHARLFMEASEPGLLAAQELCVQTHLLRYGAVAAADMQRLVASHVENKLADALAEALASKHEQAGKR
ncbi:hypothetical protein V8C86DRAFT_1549255 [Haematococcus lacustris]